MDFTIELQDMVAMLVSMICGGIIGFEREYRRLQDDHSHFFRLYYFHNRLPARRGYR